MTFVTSWDGRIHPGPSIHRRYDPDALHDFSDDVKSKSERLAVANAVDKLRRLGERLAPPHMKLLRGYGELAAATGPIADPAAVSPL